MFKSYLKRIYGFIIFHFVWLFPIKKEKVFFSCFSGKRYGDNPKYISQRLAKEYPNIKQIWTYRYTPFNDLDKNIVQVKWLSFAMIYHIATSKIWVDSHIKPEWVYKRKKQFYIETWHGGLGFKKIGLDAEEKISDVEIARMKRNSKMVDIMLSNADWTTNVYRKAFGYKGEILKIGFPKSDYLLNNTNFMKENVRRHYKLSSDTKIAFYAPTMRDNPTIETFNIDHKKVLETLKNKFGGKWIFMVRLHPVNENFQEKLFYDGSLNGMEYSDMQELIGACDIYISDYSGSIFDAALISKPIFIFANDQLSYEAERGLYMSISELPFPVAANSIELCNNIINIDLEKYNNEVLEYFDSVALEENGKSTDEIIKKIINKIKEK